MKSPEKKLSTAQQMLLKKYSNNIGQRDEVIDFNVRGEKARKVGEYAEVIKALGGAEALKIAIVDFEKAFGVGKNGRQYVRSYLHRFKVPNPRVEANGDYVYMWMRGQIK